MQVTCITCTQEFMNKYMTRREMEIMFNDIYSPEKKNEKPRDYPMLNQAWNDLYDGLKRNGHINPDNRGFVQPTWIRQLPKKEWYIDRKANSIRVVKENRTLLSVSGDEAKAIFASWDGEMPIMKHVKKQLKGRA